jgi:hypothetical protein
VVTPAEAQALQAWYHERPQDKALRRLQPLPKLPIDKAALKMGLSVEKVIELARAGLLEAEKHGETVYVRPAVLSGAF